MSGADKNIQATDKIGPKLNKLSYRVFRAEEEGVIFISLFMLQVVLNILDFKDRKMSCLLAWYCIFSSCLLAFVFVRLRKSHFRKTYEQVGPSAYFVLVLYIVPLFNSLRRFQQLVFFTLTWAFLGAKLF